MFFKESKSVETLLYFDAANHEVVTEVFIDSFEDPIVCVSATPRQMVQELVESGEYTSDQLDMFLDTLYQAIDILEKHLNGEEE